MKKFFCHGFAVLFSLLLSVTSVLAASSDKPFLWRVSSDTATVYLLGSLHAATIDMYPLPAPLYKAFDSSSYLVVEIDNRRTSPQQQLAMTQRYGIYHDGTTIDQHIAKKSWKKLQAYLQQRHMPEALIKTMKPWLINLTITINEFTRLGYDTALGIDQHFLNKAAGKPVLELETLEQQLKILSAASDKQQEIDLLATLDNLEDFADVMTTMRTLWQQGDAEQLYDAMQLEAEKYPNYKKQWKALLDERNTNMARKITSYLKGNATYFVIVGALHVGGQNGLLDLLGKKHYKIEQVLNQEAAESVH